MSTWAVATSGGAGGTSDAAPLETESSDDDRRAGPVAGAAGRDEQPSGRRRGTAQQRSTQIRSEAVIDADAVAANTGKLLATLRRHRPDAELMAVVKADGYGHGGVQSGRAALRGGAASLGVATPTEALELRAAGITAPVLAWLWPAGEDIAPAVAAGVDLGVSSLDHLSAVLVAGSAHRRPVRIHLKIDTGLGRNGVGPAELPAVLEAVASAQQAGKVLVAGLMSHLASADLPGEKSVAEQTAAFREALDRAERAGICSAARHLANTPAVLQYPSTYFDVGRCGIGIYGLDPVLRVPGADANPAGLRPAMTLRATVALTKRVPAGYGVSYGLTYRTGAETTLALVPVGYADGIPRAASSTGEVWLGNKRRRIAGRVAMDQFVVDCGDDAVTAGDPVIVFGPGDDGEPTADDWATACGTIGYEIVTRVGPRVPRRYIGQAIDDEPGSVAG
ncbi:MAG: alanine racemase [Nakamurella sp.]